MSTSSGTHETNGDLLAEVPLRRVAVAPVRRGQPPELAAARASCRQLRRKQGRTEKKRIAHLICLNLVSMLKRESKR